MFIEIEISSLVQEWLQVPVLSKSEKFTLKEWKFHLLKSDNSLLKSDIVRFHSFQSWNSLYKGEISLV